MKIRALLASALVATSAAFSVATAQPEPYPLDYWAVRDQMRSVEISPDGNYVAFMKIATKTGNPTIEVYETGDLSKKPYRIGGETLEVTGFNWVGAQQMVISFRGQVSKKIGGFNQGAYRNRLALLDVSKGKFTPLDKSSADEAFNIGFVHSLPNDPEKVLISYRKVKRGSAFRPTSYYVYNLNTRGKSLVLKGNEDVFSIGFDADANPRTANSFDSSSGEFIYLYRKPGARSWSEMYRSSRDSFETFSIQEVVPGTDDLLYVVAENGEDKRGLWTFNTDTKQFVDLIYRNPEVDVRRTISHTNDFAYPDTPVGVSYYKDKFYRVYFDNDVAKIEEATLKQLEGLVPNAGIVSISSRSEDGKTLVVSNSSDKDPGSYYLLANGRFQYLGGQKPLLKAENLAEVRYIQYPARDGRMIPGFVTVPQGEPPFPLIVLPHGGPFVQEVVIFDEWAQMLANNGYMVLQPQYRGSKGYGLDFYQAAFINGGKGGYEMQDDKDDGALFLVSEGLADIDRLGFFGWSYGGYAALIAAARPNNIYQCSMAGAAVADNTLQVNYYRSRITGSSRVEQLKFWDESISPINTVSQVNIPLLLIHGTIDQRVPIIHIKKYINEMKKKGVPYKYVELKDADHFSSTLFYRHKIKLYEEMLSFLANDCGPGGL